MFWYRSFYQYPSGSSHGWHRGSHTKHNTKCISYMYAQTSIISHTKPQNLNVSRLVLQLPLSNQLKPGVKSGMKMLMEQRRQANYIWVINNFIAHEDAAYIKGLTVFFHITATRSKLWSSSVLQYAGSVALVVLHHSQTSRMCVPIGLFHCSWSGWFSLSWWMYTMWLYTVGGAQLLNVYSNKLVRKLVREQNGWHYVDHFDIRFITTIKLQLKICPKHQS